MDRGAWRATVHVVTESQTQLSDSTHKHTTYRYHHRPLPEQGGERVRKKGEEKRKQISHEITEICRLQREPGRAHGKEADTVRSEVSVPS